MIDNETDQEPTEQEIQKMSEAERHYFEESGLRFAYASNLGILPKEYQDIYESEQKEKITKLFDLYGTRWCCLECKLSLIRKPEWNSANKKSSKRLYCIRCKKWFRRKDLRPSKDRIKENRTITLMPTYDRA